MSRGLTIIASTLNSHSRKACSGLQSANMSDMNILIYLMRRDLRLADNPIFHELATSSSHNYTHLLPLYVFPAQQVEISGFLKQGEKSPFPAAKSDVAGFWRCGEHRAKFMAESVWDLKEQLEHAGSGLCIRAGMVGGVIQDMLRGFEENAKVSGVWMTSEEGVEEKREERDVRRICGEAEVDFKVWVDEKYYIDESVFLLLLHMQRHTDHSTVGMCPIQRRQNFQMFSQPIARQLNLSGKHREMFFQPHLRTLFHNSHHSYHRNPHHSRFPPATMNLNRSSSLLSLICPSQMPHPTLQRLNLLTPFMVALRQVMNASYI
jgi:hypothetical protein